jgi:hypothetical protein
VVSNAIGWDRRLSVAAEGRGLVGHAGAVLLRACADRTGLTGALSGALVRRGVPPGWDRGLVLVQLAVTIALGATRMSDIRLLAHQAAVFGPAPSESTVRRTPAPFGPALLARVAAARARVRAHVWDLIAATERGFPWLAVAGKVLTGWVVLDLDATVIEASSKKQGAAGTFKMTYGFQCAMRRSVVSPAQPGGTRKEVPGSDDLP